MADSLRLTVLKRLTALLEGTVLTPYAGIELPATLNGLVFRGRVLFGDDMPKTMLSIIEAPRPGGVLFAGEHNARYEDFELLVQGFCPEDKMHPMDTIHSMLQDVEVQLAKVVGISNTNGEPFDPINFMLGLRNDGVVEIEIGQGVVRPPTADVSSKSFFYLPVQVGLARSPYS